MEKQNNELFNLTSKLYIYLRNGAIILFLLMSLFFLFTSAAFALWPIHIPTEIHIPTSQDFEREDEERKREEPTYIQDEEGNEYTIS